ncbi:MAG: ribosome biogenesis GTP-binding protein YsxC [Candidatus Azosocius agrarius]|nr:MAG: ribosome biogenesis GTP-binding protein YsxC [Gammaproteobacteria bacterium]
MYNNIKFIKSISKINNINYKNIEISFIGVSNSGKSSAINAITNTNISLISKTPGKTKTVNFFSINKNYYFVDTPGYGYAKLKKTYLIEIKYLIINYIKKNRSLTGIFLLIDSNFDIKKLNYQIINLIKEKKIHILLTKCDRITKLQKKIILTNINNYIKNNRKYNITFQLFSIKSKLYINKTKIKIKQWINL